MTYDFDEYKKYKQEKGEWLPKELYDLVKEKRKKSFEEWKQAKKDKGEWLPDNEYKKLKNNKRKRNILEDENNDIRDTTLKEHSLLTKKLKIEIKREVIFDTETTGVGKKDKIVEISLIEVIDGVKTGRSYQSFFNPVIKISQGAWKVHKITNEDVKDSPLFKEKAEEIISFIGTSHLVAHNANFDMNFLNRELNEAGWHSYPANRFICTLKIAKHFYEKDNSLDNLCQRFEIDNTKRSLKEGGRHSAHEDTILLYEVYKKLNNMLKEDFLTPYDFRLKN